MREPRTETPVIWVGMLTFGRRQSVALRDAVPRTVPARLERIRSRRAHGFPRMESGCDREEDRMRPILVDGPSIIETWIPDERFAIQSISRGGSGSARPS